MTSTESEGPRSAEDVELTILMPCLNESETIERCVVKALSYLESSGIHGEVVVADNGSTDGSQDLARSRGARVIDVPVRGYGAAVKAGIESAHGEFVVLGDSDDSYDFSDLDRFVAGLREGNDLVMGNRFRGTIDKGAMPFLHQYLGNPALSLIGRVFFRTTIGDFYCGIRAYRRSSFLALGAQANGMELGNEAIFRMVLQGYKVAEVPADLHPDGRSRPPHMRTWRDGWRGLRLFLLYCPRWLYVYPGIGAALAGTVLALLVAAGVVGEAGRGVAIAAVTACMLLLAAVAALSSAAVATLYAQQRGMLPVTAEGRRWQSRINLERLLVASGAAVVVPVVGSIVLLLRNLTSLEQWDLVFLGVVGAMGAAGIALSFLVGLLQFGQPPGG